MRLSEIVERLNARVVFIPDRKDPEVECVCAADLLCDILASDKQNFIILTGLVSPEVIRTAQEVGALAVIIVRGKSPHHEVVNLTRSCEVPLYTTAYPMFESCAVLASLLEECRTVRRCPLVRDVCADV